MRFEGLDHQCRGGALPFCLMMVSVLSTIIISDLEVMRRGLYLFSQSSGMSAFEIDIRNTASAQRRKHLSRPLDTAAPWPFNATCAGGYCFFGAYHHSEFGEVECTYASPTLSVASDKNLWHNPDRYRAHGNGDYHYKIISELLCFGPHEPVHTPLYRTWIRAEWRVNGRLQDSMQVEFVHSATRQYDWFQSS
jgi:hypothetical protein